MSGKGKVAALAVVLIAAPFVAVHEGVITFKYADPVSVPTVCAGETDRSVVSYKARFTRDECIAMLGASLYRHALELDKCVKVPMKDHEAAALLSIAYNVGTGAMCKSTMVAQINSGKPASVWCQQFDRWVYAKGIKLRGLVNRRAQERHMCETGTWE